MQGLRTVSLILTIIGALNWGLIGLFNWNLVEAIFGGSVAMPSMLSRIIYSLVSLWAVSVTDDGRIDSSPRGIAATG